jgi:pimeloyl-ACP methyl ester carboxylesterase
MTTPQSDHPTVVFISQLGTDGASWQPVIDKLTTEAPTFTYDRPGTGSAPPDPNPPLPYSAFAAELEQLLGLREVDGKLVIVGHSVGSLIARVFVHRNLDRIAGIVHVDGSIPRCSLWPAVDFPQPPDGDGPDATQFDNLTGEIEVVEALEPHVPAAVVTRSLGRWEPPWPNETCDPLWTAYQRQLARLHRCPLVVAKNAGHQIPGEAPALVAHLIDGVLGVGIQFHEGSADALESAGGLLDRFDA